MTDGSTERREMEAMAASPGNESRGAAIRAALARGDALACRRYAEMAGGDRDDAAVPELNELIRLAHCSRFRSRRRWMSRKRHRDWVWARIAAVNALGRIGNPEAVPALIDALFDPDPAVREAAAFVLPRFANQALRPLIRALRERPDWHLQSMQLLLATLGALRNRRATPALLQALREQLPADPTRWARQTFMLPFKLLSAATLCWWAVCLLTNPPGGEPGWQGWLEALLALVIRTFVPFLFLYMASVCLVFVPVFNRAAVSEREELVIAALQALGALEDKRGLPAVTELAANAGARTGRAALLTLQTLAPLVTAEDEERFPAQARGQLARALTVAMSSGMPDAGAEIVRALEHVGDGQAATVVERAAQRGATERLRQEAARVLPKLRARKQRERISAHLLRAATAPEDTADELLRPTEDETGVSPDELLRALDEE
jgi:hypothetical protein